MTFCDRINLLLGNIYPHVSQDESPVKYLIRSSEFEKKLEMELARSRDPQKWTYLSKLPLSEKFIRKYADQLDWTAVRYEKFREEFIEEFIDYINITALITRRQLSMSFIEQHIAPHATASEWLLIASFQTLTTNFIFEHLDTLPIEGMMYKQDFTSDFIMQHCKTRQVWSIVSARQKMDKDFIQKNFDKLDITVLCQNKRVDQAFVQRLLREKNIKDPNMMVSRHDVQSPLPQKSLRKTQQKLQKKINKFICNKTTDILQ